MIDQEDTQLPPPPYPISLQTSTPPQAHPLEAGFLSNSTPKLTTSLRSAAAQPGPLCHNLLPITAPLPRHPPCTLAAANSAKHNTSLLAEDHKFSLGHKSLSRCTSLGFLSQKGECLRIPFQPKGMLQKGKASYSFPTETDPVIPNHSPLLELSSYSVKQLPKASFIYS